MYLDFLVEIPQDTGRITENRRGETTYIEYTYDREYLPDKKLLTSHVFPTQPY